MNTPGSKRFANRYFGDRAKVIREEIAGQVDRETHASEMLECLEGVIEEFEADGGIMIANIMPRIKEVVKKVKMV